MFKPSTKPNPYSEDAPGRSGLSSGALHRTGQDISYQEFDFQGAGPSSRDGEIELEEIRPLPQAIERSHLTKDCYYIHENSLTVEAVKTLVGCFLLQMIPGCQLALGSLIVYIVSYYRKGLEYDLSADYFYPILAATIVYATALFPISNRLVTYAGNQSRPVLLVGATAGLSLQYSCAFVAYQPHMFILAYSTGFGLLKAATQATTLRAGWSHLPSRKGFVTGLVLSGYGAGGFIFSIFFQRLANPNQIAAVPDAKDGKLYFGKEIADGYPVVQLDICITWTIIILVGASLISNRQPRIDQALKEEYDSTRSAEEAWEDKAERKAGLSAILSSSTFLTIIAMGVAQFFNSMFFIQVYKEFGQQYIHDDAFLSLIGAVGALADGCCRLMGGTLLDYYDFKQVYRFIVVASLLAIGTLRWSVQNRWCYLLSSVTIMACQGAFLAMLPVLTLKVFGMRRGPEVYGFSNASGLFSSILALALVATIKQTYGFDGMFAISFFLILLAAVFSNSIDENTHFKYSSVYPENRSTQNSPAASHQQRFEYVLK